MKIKLLIPEAAEIWGIHPDTIRKSIKRRRFERGDYEKVGRDYLIKSSALRKLYGDPEKIRGGKK